MTSHGHERPYVSCVELRLRSSSFSSPPFDNEPSNDTTVWSIQSDAEDIRSSRSPMDLHNNRNSTTRQEEGIGSMWFDSEQHNAANWDSSFDNQRTQPVTPMPPICGENVEKYTQTEVLIGSTNPTLFWCSELDSPTTAISKDTYRANLELLVAEVTSCKDSNKMLSHQISNQTAENRSLTSQIEVLKNNFQLQLNERVADAINELHDSQNRSFKPQAKLGDIFNSGCDFKTASNKELDVIMDGLQQRNLSQNDISRLYTDVVQYLKNSQKSKFDAPSPNSILLKDHQLDSTEKKLDEAQRQLEMLALETNCIDQNHENLLDERKNLDQAIDDQNDVRFQLNKLIESLQIERRELASLSLEKEQYVSDIASLEQEHVEAEEKVSDVQLRLQQINEQLEGSRADYTRLKQTNFEMEQQMVKYNNAIASVNTNSEVSDAKIRELRLEFDRELEDKAEIEMENHKLNDQLRHVKLENEHANSRLMVLDKEIANLRVVLVAKDQHIQQLTEKVDEFEHQKAETVTGMSAEIERLNRFIKDAQATTEREIETFKLENEALLKNESDRTRDSDTEQGRLEHELKELKLTSVAKQKELTKLHQAEHDHEMLRSQFEQLEQRYDSLEDEKRLLANQYDDLKGQLVTSTSTSLASVSERDALNARISDLESLLSEGQANQTKDGATKESVDVLTDKCSEMVVENDRLRGQLDQLKSRFEQQEAKWSHEKYDLRQRYEEAQQEKHALRDEVIVLQNKLASSNSATITPTESKNALNSQEDVIEVEKARLKLEQQCDEQRRLIAVLRRKLAAGK